MLTSASDTSKQATRLNALASSPSILLLKRRDVKLHSRITRIGCNDGRWTRSTANEVAELMQLMRALQKVAKESSSSQWLLEKELLFLGHNRPRQLAAPIG